MAEWFLRLKTLDRRIIYIFLALTVGLPMVFPFEFPIIPGKNTQNLYAFIERLPPGTRTYVSFDYDPGSMPEIHPAAIAILTHMFLHGLKPICGANWQVGGELADLALASATQIFQEIQQDRPAMTVRKTGLKYGEDFVNLGFKPGGIVHLKRLTGNFLGPFPTDKKGMETATMGIFGNPDARPFSMRDVGIIVSISGGNHGIEEFISISGDHQRPMGTACTSVKIPKYYTYVQTGQLIGMTGGMPGAAEYEKLIEYSGPARKGMTPQSLAHLGIMLFIILGNLIHLLELKTHG